MFPAIGNITSFVPQQVTLVATPLLDAQAMPVQANAAPPPVSSAQVNNNARGNGSFIVLENTAALSVPVVSAAHTVPVGGGSVPSSNISATFLAQLIAQDIPVAQQSTFNGVLAEYEKIVADSFTKYKPSFASLPHAAPSNAFGEILQQERGAPPAPPAPPARSEPIRPEPPVIQKTDAAPAVQATVTAAAPQVKEIIRKSEPVRRQQAPTPVAFATSAASAYKASAARVEAYAAETTVH